jgi:hypothetical protein
MNPNVVHGQSHWILYDFGNQYKLGQMHVWNTNDPAHLDWGMRDVMIDVSIDGNTWHPIGEFTLSQASGLSTHEGETGPDLEGVEARYLLLTAQTNWGGSCFGLSEIRIEAEETIISTVHSPTENDCFNLSAAPNPFTDRVHVNINSVCTGTFEYQVVDMLGRVVRSGTAPASAGAQQLQLDFDNLPQGTYQLRIIQDEITGYLTLVKMQKT